MDAAKFIQLQNEIKVNQSELQEYLKDLENWENEIQVKEKALKQNPAGVVKDSMHSLPPVRNSLLKKKVKKRKIENPNKPQRIPGSDFRAWDKFDVDGALKGVDKDDPPSEYETDEEWEVERKKQQALVEKDMGNRCYKENKFEEAVACYTKAIDCDPTNALFYSNRAMALLKLKQFDKVEQDCNEAIFRDPAYLKTYLRRATARRQLGKLHEALADCQHALKLEPDNHDAQKEADIIKQIMAGPAPKSGIVLPLKKSPQERSKKPLRRIVIEEIGVETVAEVKQQAEQRRQRQEALASSSGTARARMDVAKDEAVFDRLADGSTLADTKAVPDPAAARGQPIIGSPADLAAADSARWSAISSPADIAIAGQPDLQPNVILEQCQLSSPQDPSSSSSDLPVTTTVATNGHAASHSSGTPEDVRQRFAALSPNAALTSSRQPQLTPSVLPGAQTPVATKVPPRPMSSYQLQADWKLVRSNLDKVYNYVKQIPPSSYPKLFGESLDADVLVTLLRAFSDCFLPAGESVSEHLQWLTRVKRFDMVIMFLSAAERSVVSKIFDLLPPSSANRNELRAKYGLL